MQKKFSIQVQNGYYKENYDDLQRFISYYYQTHLAIRLNPKSILEIGIGNKTTINYLKNYGFKVTSCDFDESLNPDICSDIRDLVIQNNSFDLVIACEVLEHIPWHEVEKALSELHRVSSKYVLLSIPYFSLNFEMAIILPMLNTLFKKNVIDVFFRIPYLIKKYNKIDQHYWEIGRSGTLLRSVRKKIKLYFTIKEEIRPVLNPKHLFFVLEKKI